MFISPRNRVAQLYPQALGFISVVSYISQGYSRGIQPFLHAGIHGAILLERLFAELVNNFLSCYGIQKS
jgi:hypothetical protein